MLWFISIVSSLCMINFCHSIWANGDKGNNMKGKNTELTTSNGYIKFIGLYVNISEVFKYQIVLHWCQSFLAENCTENFKLINMILKWQS
jgi:hypothetical protein